MTYFLWMSSWSPQTTFDHILPDNHKYSCARHTSPVTQRNTGLTTKPLRVVCSICLLFMQMIEVSRKCEWSTSHVKLKARRSNTAHHIILCDPPGLYICMVVLRSALLCIGWPAVHSDIKACSLLYHCNLPLKQFVKLKHNFQ